MVLDAHADEIHDKYVGLFIPELPNYTLRYETEWFCDMCGDNQADYVIRQNWGIPDDLTSVDNELNIIYEIFPTVAIAQRMGVRNPYASPHYWGSYDGNIAGDNGIYYPNTNIGMAMNIVRGNIVVRISQVPAAPLEGLMLPIQEIAGMALNRMGESLLPEVRAEELAAKETQIEQVLYDEFVSGVLSSSSFDGFTKTGVSWDSKWPVNDERFVAGRRTEWERSDGYIVGIDMCRFATSDEARLGMDILKTMTRATELDPADLSQLDENLAQWDRSSTRRYYKSCVIFNNYGLFFYQYHPEKPSSDLHRDLVDEIVQRLSF